MGGLKMITMDFLFCDGRKSSFKIENGSINVFLPDYDSQRI
jgi:hypothetical protein